MLSASDHGSRSAVLSTCGRYRYALERSTGVAGPNVVWVMLNPSTADADRDDPTIRKVVGFSRLHRFGVAMVVNLFAWRETSPRVLRGLLQGTIGKGPIRAQTAEGPENERAIRGAVELAEVVICAWGAQPWACAQADRVIPWLAGKRLVCLGTTKDGSPRHPLMVAYSQPLVPFVRALDAWRGLR